MSDRTTEGYNAAKEAIARGEDPRTLRGQASSDLDPDTFTKGWKAACDGAIADAARNQGGKTP